MGDGATTHLRERVKALKETARGLRRDVMRLRVRNADLRARLRGDRLASTLVTQGLMQQIRALCDAFASSAPACQFPSPTTIPSD